MAFSSSHLADGAGDSSIPAIYENSHEFIIVWFYTGDELDQNSEFLMKLHFKTENLRIFDQCESCCEYIELTKDKDIVLIITVKYASQAVQILHDLQQLDSIYVYNLSDLLEQHWIHRYVKVSYHVILLAINPSAFAIRNFCNCTIIYVDIYQIVLIIVDV
jgi:hypothetical protein